MSTTFTNHQFRKAPPSRPAPKKVKLKHPNIIAIFDKPYRVRIRSNDVYSIEEQRQNGQLSTGSRRLDDAIRKETRIISATINDMVEYYRNGTSFWITQLEDSKSIYDAVCAHTAEWRMALMYTMNMGDPPVEDLILMEQFASKMYEHARYEYEKPRTGFSGGRTLSEFLFSRDVQMGSIRKNGEYAISEGYRAEGTVKDQTHIPDTDVFKRALVASMGNKHHGE